VGVYINQAIIVIGWRVCVAPEAFGDRPVATCDIRALGVIAYDLVARRPLDPWPNSRLCKLAGHMRRPIIRALIAVAVIGILALLRSYSPNKKKPDQIQTIPSAVLWRHLSYSIEAKRDPKRYLHSKPFAAFDNVIFGAGDQIRFHISSPQSGSLYIINAGPTKTNGLPNFNVLFPDTETNGGSPEIRAGQIVQIPLPSEHPLQDWFVFDEEDGVENIWFVWSERNIPELEAVKSWANPRDLGSVGSLKQRAMLAQYLAVISEIKPIVERDEVTKQTTLKGKGAMLMCLIKLEHH
jgi:hypothetical protein